MTLQLWGVTLISILVQQCHQVAAAGVWHLSPDVWTAIGTCSASGAAVVAVIVGLSQLKEARRLRREQAQPYVAVFAESSANHPAQIDLVIKNFGATPARDIRVTFAPEPQSANLRNSGITRGVQVPEVISLLVPGQEWRTYWDWSAALAKADDLPRRYDVSVTFSDLRGKRIKPDSEFVIDWQVLFAQAPINVNSPHDAAGALMDIRDVMKKASGSNGLMVAARDGDKLARRDRRFWSGRARFHRVEDGEASRLDKAIIRAEAWTRRQRRRLRY